jgi:putative transposase
MVDCQDENITRKGTGNFRLISSAKVRKYLDTGMPNLTSSSPAISHLPQFPWKRNAVSAACTSKLLPRDSKLRSGGIWRLHGPGGRQRDTDPYGRKTGALDNTYVERFFRALKYEEIYLNEYENPRMLRKALEQYICYYNDERQHEALGY